MPTPLPIKVSDLKMAIVEVARATMSLLDRLPCVLVDSIVCHAGPIALAREKRCVAAVRIQRLWRLCRLSDGARVLFRYPWMRRWREKIHATVTVHSCSQSTAGDFYHRSQGLLDNRRLKVTRRVPMSGMRAVTTMVFSETSMECIIMPCLCNRVGCSHPSRRVHRSTFLRVHR